MLWEIYSDGSSSGRSDEPGGWAWVLCQNQQPIASKYGGHYRTTNNIMEMTGAIEGLNYLKDSKLWQHGQPVILISDSKITLGLANGTMSASVNKELAKNLRDLLWGFRGTTRWVKGHQFKKSMDWTQLHKDVMFNHRCDQLADLGRKEACALIGQML